MEFWFALVGGLVVYLVARGMRAEDQQSPSEPRRPWLIVHRKPEPDFDAAAEALVAGGGSVRLTSTLDPDIAMHLTEALKSVGIRATYNRREADRRLGGPVNPFDIRVRRVDLDRAREVLRDLEWARN